MTTSLRKYKHDLYADINKIKDGLSGTTDGIKDLIGDSYHKSLENVKETSLLYKDTTANFIADNPFKSVAISILSGFIIGYLFKRK